MSYALTKQPWEDKIYQLAYPLNEGETLAGVDSLLVTPRGRVAEIDPLLATDAVVSGDQAQFRVAGGTDGEDYAIRVRVLTSNGDKLEEDVQIRVQDFTWAIPDGQGHIYVSPAEFVTKYDYDTVLVLTDTHQVGRIDVERLGQALQYATAMADGYAAKRYQTPLDPVPEIIKGAVLAIAFYELHTENVPDSVAGKYAKAMEMLKALSRGDVTLSANAAKPTATSGGPSFTGPERTFSRDSLKGF